MNETESYTHEELKEKVRGGWQLFPTTPGLNEAAREVIRPLLEGLEGKRIVYHCRVSCLMRVERLTMDEKGFRAVATPLYEIPHSEPGLDAMRPKFKSPYEFWGSWSMYHLYRGNLKPAMCGDFIIVDQAVVTELEAMVERGESPKAVYDVIYGRKESGG